MIPALSIENIERQCKRLNTRGIVVIMAAYNGEDAGPIYELLSHARDYNYHSGQQIDLHCAGYHLYVPPADLAGDDDVVMLPDIFHPITAFDPKLFHNIRQHISVSLGRKWNYVGGVDLLLFSGTEDRSAPINWSRAAIVSSSKHVKGAFQSVDEMVRTVINLNEEYKGGLVPDILDPVVTQRVFMDRLGKVAGKIGAALVTGAFKFVGA
jgi:hypothetical protein